MKRIGILLLAAALALCLCACSTDTYTPQSTLSTFKLKNVSAITLYGPGVNGGEAVETQLLPDGGADYTRLVTLVQGKRQDTCDTNNFGLCYIAYAVETGDTIKVYPANDGSPYVCLYSLNPRVAKYLTLSEEDMKQVTDIMEKYGIQVNYL